MEISPTYLDGNAAAGPLSEFLNCDITMAVGHCANCQAGMVMARSRVYSGPGLVLRCAFCDHVLARLVVAAERAWLDLSGLSSLRINRCGQG